MNERVLGKYLLSDFDFGGMTVNHYKRYYSLFKEYSMDMEDLLQEIQIKIIVALKKMENSSIKDKPLEEIQKLMNIIVQRDLLDITRVVFRKVKPFLVLKGELKEEKKENKEENKEEEEKEQEEEKKEREKKEKLERGKVQRVFNYDIENHGKEDPRAFKIEEIKTLCSKVEYLILEKKFVENMSLRDISGALKEDGIIISAMWVHKKYKRILKKLKFALIREFF